MLSIRPGGRRHVGKPTHEHSGEEGKKKKKTGKQSPSPSTTSGVSTDSGWTTTTVKRVYRNGVLKRAKARDAFGATLARAEKQERDALTSGGKQ